MPFNVLVVGSEKELNEFLPYVQAAKKFVGPIRIFKETRSVQACEQAQEAAGAGGLHAVLLSNHFTAPGKAEFSDALRKVLRDQFHDTPILCWGHPSKGGDKGKHYHHALDEMDEVGPMLAKVKSKELVAEWKEKGEKKGLFGRKSIDRASPRPSMDQAPKKTPEQTRKPPPPPPEPEEEAPAPRRRSIDRSSEGAPVRRKSIDSHRASKELQRASMDMFGPNAGFSGMGNLGGSMSGMGGMGGMSGMDPMTGMQGFGGMGGGMGMGMPGLGMAPMQPGMMGTAGVAPPSVDTAAMMMGGMNTLINARPGSTMMQPPPQPMAPQPYMQPQQAMPHSRSSTEHVIQQFSSAVQAQSMAAPGGMQAAPMSSPSQVPGAADPAAMMAGMSMNDSSNTALIKMLAEEVVSLRKQLEAKEAHRRASMDPQAMAAYAGAPRPIPM